MEGSTWSLLMVVHSALVHSNYFEDLRCQCSCRFYVENERVSISRFVNPTDSVERRFQS